VDKGPVGDLEISRRPGGLPRGSAGQPAPPNVFSWLHPRTHTRRSVGRGACDTVSFSVTQMPFIIVCVVEVAHAQREQPARSAIFVQQADAGSIVIRADGATHRPPRDRARRSPGYLECARRYTRSRRPASCSSTLPIVSSTTRPVQHRNRRHQSERTRTRAGSLNRPRDTSSASWSSSMMSSLTTSPTTVCATPNCG